MKKKNLLFTAIAILGFAITTMAQVPSYLPTNGLVSWYPFNGNANDESGNGNNGTVNGATTTTDRFGNSNSAYNFNGNPLDSIGIDINMPYGDFTISFWYNAIDTINNSLFDWRNTLNPQPQINFTFDNVGFKAMLRDNINYTTTDISVNFIPLGNKWQFITLTLQSNQMKLFINSSLKGSTNYAQSNWTLNHLLLGNNYYSRSWFYTGKLDDIGIWNRALTQAEITGLYNGNLCYQYITVTDTLLINTNITGFSPITYQNTIKVWPNPTKDHITIDNGNIANMVGYQLKITNSLGQQVFQSVINQQQFYVDLASWTGNGIYFVYIINGQGQTIDIKKIVLQ